MYLKIWENSWSIIFRKKKSALEVHCWKSHTKRCNFNQAHGKGHDAKIRMTSSGRPKPARIIFAFSYIHLSVNPDMCKTYLVQTVDNTGSTTTTISTKCNWFSSLSSTISGQKRMKLFVLFSAALILATSLHLSHGAAEETGEPKKPKKLQIGVKKRVENCEQKSRRGDLLSMHYTVSQFSSFIRGFP